MFKNTKEDVTYASILADGKFHVPANEGDEGAVLRTYETSDGKQGSKWEKVYTQLMGKITKLNFREGDYGNQFQVTIEDTGQKPVILSLSTASNYGEDLMKKIFSVNFEKKVKLVPYSFTDEKQKSRKGITVWQFSEAEQKAIRVNNYFYDIEKKKNINGYPEPKKGKITKANPEGKLTTDQWKMYFMETRQFLVDKITEDFKIEAETVESADWSDFAETPAQPDIEADNIEI